MMWSLPDITSLNARAKSCAGAYHRQSHLGTSAKYPCECCGEPSTVHNKWDGIFSEDAKGVQHLCQSCADNGRGEEGYFTCDACGRLMVENYTWELYTKRDSGTDESICLVCAAERFLADDANLINPKLVKSVVLEPDSGKPLFDPETGEVNLACAEHVRGVAQPLPKGIRFVDNWEFDSCSGHQISGGDVLFDLQQITEPLILVCDTGYQFSISIGAYVRRRVLLRPRVKRAILDRRGRRSAGTSLRLVKAQS